MLSHLGQEPGRLSKRLASRFAQIHLRMLMKSAHIEKDNESFFISFYQFSSLRLDFLCLSWVVIPLPRSTHFHILLRQYLACVSIFGSCVYFQGNSDEFISWSSSHLSCCWMGARMLRMVNSLLALTFTLMLASYSKANIRTKLSVNANQMSWNQIFKT